MSEGAVFQCSECGLHYTDKEIAKKCEKWCSKYKSCNLAFIKFSVEVIQAKTDNETK